MPTSASSAFRLIRQHHIDAINVCVQHYQHQATGAVHFHLQADNPENVFLLGFRTVPMDHQGAAHILEHTALCGSEKYPVRDPFFMMIRRSLNTFMNAFTSNDWTAYPFASCNTKDFYNLLDVYLDAAFFANLDELDFLQEGHRLAFSEADNPDSDLEYKGVVYNEMKGAMSSVNSTLWQTLCKYLFPNTTYHYNSGGDPEHIPDLSYQALQDFYKQHYHPSNAMFVTFGNQEASDLQAVFEEKALHRFTEKKPAIKVADEKRLQAPMAVEEFYAFDSQEPAKQQDHIVVGWLLGQSHKLEDVIKAQLLSFILLENSASPLLNYIETCTFAKSPSAICGLEDSYKELVFVCGVSGAKEQHAQQFEQEVLTVLQKVADEGVSQNRLEAIVEQLELSQREISGDGFPYGLQLILQALTSVTHYSDPVALLDLEPVLAKLREDIKQPTFVSDLINDLLLNNQHRVRLNLKPDTELSKKRQAAEKAKLQAIKEDLSDDEKHAIIEKNQALEARQSAAEDAGLLPKVGLDDVATEISEPASDNSEVNGLPLSHFNQGVNGLAYQQLLVKLPKLSDEQTALLPLYCQLITELGFGEYSFQEVQNLQSDAVGGINAACAIRPNIDDENILQGYLCISAKSLARKQAQMAWLIQQSFLTLRFDELPRIKDIIEQNHSRKQQSITSNGHALAMTCASQTLAPIAKLNELFSGMTSIVKSGELEKLAQSESGLKSLSEQLQALHQQISACEKRLLSISEQSYQQAISGELQNLWRDAGHNDSHFAIHTTAQIAKQAWLCNSQVNFCAKAYKTVPTGHKDSAALTVLGGFLRNGFLHTAIREKGGAYGGGAMQDNAAACFKFFSYRDPRISGTLNDFDQAINWLLTHKHSQEALEEAILGVVSSLDKPGSPAGEAKQAFQNELFGRTKEKRQAFREQVLNTTIDDLIRVGKTYLQQTPSTAVICGDYAKDELATLELNVNVL